ncbi:anti-phage dCTP deaminase [Paraburkholderia phenoliruptrix]|uniref:anti-phage dCTP deaminase n=1 Tax=Paraburkholderia phenoliruptrix TaxID=252970 RepID=UPI002866690E|nr:anti-phage dCTP deaminase [Paraburkholderia phenoliruptrix]MDR6387557.1 deoxycytidylate deaminase [Paraburkholderia phenoliruptrix]
MQKNDTKSEDVKTTLEKRASKEMVIAFMGAAGCGLPRVITECQHQLESLGYRVERIKLSKFIKDHRDTWKSNLSPDDVDISYLENQTGGNFFRKMHSHDILAQYAVNHIARFKFATNSNAGNTAIELPQVAYLIDQIKHPDEAALLRLTYRNLFYLVGVMSTNNHRLARLKDQGLDENIANRIMERDRKETESYGQHLEKAFKMADYFIQHPLGRDEAIPRQMDRFLKLAHGNNSITPTRHEHAMYVAHASGMKSACFSRQVGASILDAKGKLIAVGCNDVPQYGGGLYTAESREDQRCAYRKEKICENDRQKKIRKDKIRSGLTNEIASLFKDAKTKLAVTSNIDSIVDLAYKYSGIPDLIEFSRAVHAEMDAIVSVSREGGASTVGGTLYTTTFPCHNCARHIVAAGIDKVYYIEPYEKSLALASHGDSIVVLDHDVEDNANVDGTPAPPNQVKFIHFAGAAPRVYPKFFHRDKRKDGDGNFVEWSGENGSSKIMVEYLDSYRDFEAKVSQRFEDAFPLEPGNTG